MSLIRLPSVAMTTDAELDNKRRGFWLRMARERANYNQAAVAEQLGLSSQSKSTMSAWEAGTREPKLRYLKAMAALYRVPLKLFTDPPATAFEDLDAVVRGASAIESEDWATEVGERGPAADDEPDASPRRQSA